MRARPRNGAASEDKVDKVKEGVKEERSKGRQDVREVWRRMVSGRSPRGLYYGLALCLTMGLWCSVMLVTSHGGEGRIRRWEEHFADQYAKDFREEEEWQPHHDVDDEELKKSIKDAMDAGIQFHKDPELPVQFPAGSWLNVAVSMPFLDHQPLMATDYINMLEWITIYSSVNINFHVITNDESKPFIDKILDKVNLTSNCNFKMTFVSLNSLVEEAHGQLCPQLKASEEYCDLLIAKMTPLLFPFYFRSLPYMIYIDKHMTFHDDVGKLYNTFTRLDKEQAIAMVQQQSLKYMRSFGSYHVKAPGTKLGFPPKKGHPGYNPDLLLMDLDKLRSNNNYKKLITELKMSLLLKKYSYHPQMVDKLHEEFLDCVTPDAPVKLRASNKNPDLLPKPSGNSDY